jgi:hypothetical protein
MKERDGGVFLQGKTYVMKDSKGGLFLIRALKG